MEGARRKDYSALKDRFVSDSKEVKKNRTKEK